MLLPKREIKCELVRKEHVGKPEMRWTDQQRISKEKLRGLRRRSEAIEVGYEV
jgi:hypothetical protein